MSAPADDPFILAGVDHTEPEFNSTLLLAELAVDVPKAFVAVTVKVYAVPVVRPVTVIGELVPVAVMPPGDDVTVKLVAAEPLGVNRTLAAVKVAADATPIEGAAGAVRLVAKRGALVPLRPTATNKPEELTVTPCMVAAAVEPFISAGVVQVEPLDEVAYKGALELLAPIATNNPEELTVTPYIVAAAVEPFINAGVVHVEPFEEVA
jgi:hypothetical protein